MITERLKRLREESGLTQAELAAKLGTERSNYARLENRGESLTIAQLRSICEALGANITDVLDETPTPNKQTSKGPDIKTLERKIKELKTENGLLRNFVDWVVMLFRNDFAAMKEVVLPERTTSDEIPEDELRVIGESLFSIDSPYYFWGVFMGSSGFISEKWFIDAYKRSSRRLKISTNTAEAIKWVNGVIEYISDEDDESEEE